MLPRIPLATHSCLLPLSVQSVSSTQTATSSALVKSSRLAVTLRPRFLCRFGEDPHTTVADILDALTGGELTNGTREDFVPIEKSISSSVPTQLCSIAAGIGRQFTGLVVCLGSLSTIIHHNALFVWVRRGQRCRALQSHLLIPVR